MSLNIQQTNKNIKIWGRYNDTLIILQSCKLCGFKALAGTLAHAGQNGSLNIP